MKEGTIRKMPIAVLKAMVEASIEKFLSSDALIEGKIEYNDALQIMVDIVMNGIAA